jgi:5'-nucleotidase
VSIVSNDPLILVTNDDGFDSPGIAALTEAVTGLGRVIVVAPDREQSATSHSLTIERPLRVFEVADGRYRVDGTPTDCVHLGVDTLTDGRLPDLVVSGINRGLNIGDDVIYSGTVAGAMEGTLLHIPSIAFSAQFDEQRHADYQAPKPFVTRVASQVLRRGLPGGVLLNVNFPCRSPRGVKITRQGSRTYRATSLERLDPAGRPYYWIAGAETTPGDEADGDHLAIRQGYVSVSALHTNLTHEPSLAALASWKLELD